MLKIIILYTLATFGLGVVVATGSILWALISVVSILVCGAYFEKENVKYNEEKSR